MDSNPPSGAGKLFEAVLSGGLAPDQVTRRGLWVLLTMMAIFEPIAHLGAGKPLGLNCALVPGYTLFLIVWLRFRPETNTSLRLGAALNGLLPAVGFVELARGEFQPQYLLSVWFVPILAVVLIGSSALRLRADLPLITGGACAAGVAWVQSVLVVERLQAVPVLLDGYLAVRITQPAMILVTALGVAVFVRRIVKLLEKRARELRAADLFGKYRLGEQIAAGGMGVVSHATYCPEGGFVRQVAIKRIHPHLATDETTIAEFRREAELSARLQHPGIVSVLDFGRAGDTYFLAMEYVDGADLREIQASLKRRQQTLSTPVVGLIGRQIAEALHFAHDVAVDADGQLLRVIHRDLSPNNILVSRPGITKVADFGIARALYDTDALQTERVSGKFTYMAPEQAEGGPIGPRADLFCLGVILWELLAGRRLFGHQRRERTAILLELIRLEIPDLRSLRPDVSPAWCALLSSLLQREPHHRPESARSVVQALKAILEEDGAPHPDELPDLVAQTLADRDPELTDPFQRAPLGETQDTLMDPSAPTVRARGVSD